MATPTNNSDRPYLRVTFAPDESTHLLQVIVDEDLLLKMTPAELESAWAELDAWSAKSRRLIRYLSTQAKSSKPFYSQGTD
jgi:hypothetical protein